MLPKDKDLPFSFLFGRNALRNCFNLIETVIDDSKDIIFTRNGITLRAYKKIFDNKAYPNDINHYIKLENDYFDKENELKYDKLQQTFPDRIKLIESITANMMQIKNQIKDKTKLIELQTGYEKLLNKIDNMLRENEVKLNQLKDNINNNMEEKENEQKEAKEENQIELNNFYKNSIEKMNYYMVKLVNFEREFDKYNTKIRANILSDFIRDYNDEYNTKFEDKNDKNNKHNYYYVNYDEMIKNLMKM